MKDNFSNHSADYARFRPSYPDELFQYLNSIVPSKQKAWDCGTGNGQVAFELAKTFEQVFATDISQSQIDNAIREKNIIYSVQPAENTNFPNQHFDLITIAQAIHWFDFDQFYNEVKRTAKPNAVIAVIGYGREISEEIDKVIQDFYNNTIGPYWDKERKYIDENYQTIPFPFTEIAAPQFVNRLHWSLEHLIGYINTWSAVKHFIKENGYNPVDNLHNTLNHIWTNDETREVRFPLHLRIGIVNN